jgi:DNA-directed RNA polymerase subunit RPC12/RpoP
MTEQVVSGSVKAKTRSKYKEGHGYCSRCRRFFLLETLGMPNAGIPRCPSCGILLRMKPRHSRYKRGDIDPEKFISAE